MFPDFQNALSTFFHLVLVLATTSAAMSWIPGSIKGHFLAQDHVGRMMAIGGSVAVGVGLLTGALASMYLLSYAALLWGTMFTTAGVWIAMEDERTNRWLSSQAGLGWAAATVVVFAGTVGWPSIDTYTTYRVMLLGLPSLIAGAALCVMVFSIDRRAFSVILAQDMQGLALMPYGLLFLFAATLAGNDIPAMIGLTGVAALVATFGGLIALPDTWSNKIISRWALLPAGLVFLVSIWVAQNVF